MSEKILIVCEAGISAALFVSKMIEENERRKGSFEIDYAPISRVEKKLSQENYNILLLTPQVQRHEDELGELLKRAECSSKLVFIKDQEFISMNIPAIYDHVKEVL